MNHTDIKVGMRVRSVFSAAGQKRLLDGIVTRVLPPVGRNKGLIFADWQIPGGPVFNVGVYIGAVELSNDTEAK